MFIASVFTMCLVSLCVLLSRFAIVVVKVVSGGSDAADASVACVDIRHMTQNH